MSDDQVTEWRVDLPEGQVVAGLSVGDPQGYPVFLQHGTPASRHTALLGAAAARRTGVRLIAPNRPGYRGSTLTAPGLRSVGEDVVRLADHFGIAQYAVLGVSGGGPYAIACAVVAPERVTALGLAVATGPWREIEPVDAEHLLEDRAVLEHLDAGDLEAALEGFRAQGARELGPLLELDDAALAQVFADQMLPREMAWFDVEGTRQVWADTWREALASYDGFARDNVAWGGPWDVDVREVSVPTFLWYGDDDAMISPEHGRWLAARIPGARLVVRTDSGHGSTIFSHWDEVLTTLRPERP